MRRLIYLIPLGLLLACSATPSVEPLDVSDWPASPAHSAASPPEAKAYQLILTEVRQGELEKAQKATEALLATHRQDANLYLLKVKILLTRGRQQEALDFLTTQIQEQPDFVELLALRGQVLLDLGYKESAKQDLIAAEAAGVVRVELQVALAQIYQEDKNLHRAVEHLRKAIAIEPENDQLWFQRAQAELQLGQLQQALLSSMRTIELKPNNPRYQQFYIDFLSYTGQKSALGRQLKEMVKRFPDEPWFALHLSTWHIEQMELLPAKQVIEEALKHQPKDHLLHFQLATILGAEKEYDRAVEHFKQGLETKPESYLAMVQIGRIYLAQNELEQAVEWLEKARETGSRDLFVFESLARIYNQRGDSFLAEQVIVEGLNLEGDNTALLLEYGTLLERRRKYDKATLAFEEALKQHPKNNFILGKLGNLYRISKNYDKAVQYLETASKAQPRSPWIKAHLVELYTETENWPKALSEIEEMMEQNPDDYWPYAKRALIRLKQERLTEAESDIKQAIDKNPEAHWLREFEGQILARLDRPKEAARAFELALASNPDNAFLLVRLGYARLHFDRDKALEAVTAALDLEDFELSGLELYLYLKGQTAQTWGFEPQGLEAQIYELIIHKKTEQASAALKKLKSPYQPYLKFFADILEEGPNARLSVYSKKPLQGAPAWFGFYQAAHAMFLKEQDQALAHLQASHQARPEDPWIQARLAYGYELDKQYEPAIQLLNQHLTQRPQSLWAKLRLALNYDMAGHPKESESMYLEILAQYPEDHIALNNLAWLYVTAKDPALRHLEKALELSQKAVKLSPTSANLDTLAEIYFLKQQYKMALRTIERALDQDRESLDYFKKQKKKILRALQASQGKD
ncbi:MAG: tetratricopeptide repeat protein [bacterium]|nr:tetratricopeptide repeat protein [bacterium]